MIQIWIKERGGFGKEILHKEISEDEIPKWEYDEDEDIVVYSYKIVPFLADIDHKRFTVRVTDERGVELWDYTTEWCSNCGEEVVIAPFGISFCAECGKPITPCSMCEASYVNCGNCPYWEDAYNTEAER